jgi:hypothetical protein
MNQTNPTRQQGACSSRTLPSARVYLGDLVEVELGVCVRLKTRKLGGSVPLQLLCAFVSNGNGPFARVHSQMLPGPLSDFHIFAARKVNHHLPPRKGASLDYHNGRTCVSLRGQSLLTLHGTASLFCRSRQKRDGRAVLRLARSSRLK